jgi:hypothetical protein
MAYMVETCRYAVPSMVDRIESVEAWHFPLLSTVEDTVQILRWVAGEQAS